MSVIENLIKMRKKFGYSQEQVASKLGISRQTYNSMEKNEGAISAKELETIADFFGVPVEEFYYGVQNTDKFKQMYRYILTRFRKTGGIQKTKLAKLLYLSDFRHFYEHLESMSNVLYKCKTYGPLADPFLELTDSMFESGEISIDCLSMGAQMISINSQLNDEDFSLLSEDEKREIDEICDAWKDANTQTIVNFTHKQKPWMACRENEIIPYELILQEDPENVYKPIA